jgi:hypothetical protein
VIVVGMNWQQNLLNQFKKSGIADFWDEFLFERGAPRPSQIKIHPSIKLRKWLSEWRLSRRLLALVLTAVMATGLASCGGSSSNGSTATILKPSRSKLVEVSPPFTIQTLRQALEANQPQVKILSPRSDQVLGDTEVKVELQVKDLDLYKDADLGLGPYLQVWLDNQPYSQVYDPAAAKQLRLENLAPGTHTIRAFAVRPWHESFKNEAAYAQTTFHVFTKTPENQPHPGQPLLTYNYPQGVYGAEPVLLDFFLTDAPLHLVAREDAKDNISDWQIRCTINGDSFTFDRWEPIYLKGLKPGKNWVQLELLDEKGNLLPNAFNNTVQVITYEPGGTDTLAQLTRGELTADAARKIVDPNYVPPAPPAEPEPEVIEPEVVKPEVIEPEVTEPEVTEPEVTEPEVIAPGLVVPEVKTPEQTEPEVKTPVKTPASPPASEPKATEPKVTETEPAKIAPLLKPEVPAPDLTEEPKPEAMPPEVMPRSRGAASRPGLRGRFNQTQPQVKTSEPPMNSAQSGDEAEVDSIPAFQPPIPPAKVVPDRVMPVSPTLEPLKQEQKASQEFEKPSPTKRFTPAPPAPVKAPEVKPEPKASEPKVFEPKALEPKPTESQPAKFNQQDAKDQVTSQFKAMEKRINRALQPSQTPSQVSKPELVKPLDQPDVDNALDSAPEPVQPIPLPSQLKAPSAPSSVPSKTVPVPVQTELEALESEPVESPFSLSRPPNSMNKTKTKPDMFGALNQVKAFFEGLKRPAKEEPLIAPLLQPSQTESSPPPPASVLSAPTTDDPTVIDNLIDALPDSLRQSIREELVTESH